MSWWKRKERERDLERELRSDLELEAAEQEEKGLSAEEARYAARVIVAITCAAQLRAAGEPYSSPSMISASALSAIAKVEFWSW